jgi:hypothetical protein
MTSRQRLLLRKRKIEALLPLVSTERSRNMRIELREINEQLSVSAEADPRSLLREPLSAAAGVNGVGGLYFEQQSPPGIGRLIRLPFYLSEVPIEFPGSVITASGAGQPSFRNPVVIVQIPVGQRAISGLVLETPVIEWALLRIVGFQASQSPYVPTELQPDLDLATNLWPFLLVKELAVGGGANLLSAEGYIDAAVYTDRVPEFAGLRGYPVIETPNNCSVRAAVSGASDPNIVDPVTLDPLLTSVSFSLNLVCEVLDDTSYGSHIPGPYARRDAMLRRPSPDGGFARE